MFLVGTVLLQEHNRSRYLPGISTCSTDIKKGFAGMSGNYTAREVEFYLLRNLELSGFRPLGVALTIHRVFSFELGE
jgi:hypothetical protein